GDGLDQRPDTIALNVIDNRDGTDRRQDEIANAGRSCQGSRTHAGPEVRGPLSLFPQRTTDRSGSGLAFLVHDMLAHDPIVLAQLQAFLGVVPVLLQVV